MQTKEYVKTGLKINSNKTEYFVMKESDMKEKTDTEDLIYYDNLTIKTRSV